MAEVIYDGNGSDGGQVPVDSNNYTPGETVNLLDNVNLTRTDATFLHYWNTASDGSGTYHGGTRGNTFTFPNQTDDLILFAQWAVTTGLTNGGKTTNYAFFYDENLGGPGGIEPNRTNAVIDACDDASNSDFAWMQNQFKGVDISQKMHLPIPTLVTALDDGSGGISANWAGTDGPLTLNVGTGIHNSSDNLRTLIVLEVVEMFMLSQNKGWGYSSHVTNEESCGEALSIFLCRQFQLSKGISGNDPFTTRSSDNWLNSSLPANNLASTEFFDDGENGPRHYGQRTDYVNSTLPFAGNGPGTGCSLLFIYYLFTQLGFSDIQKIIASAPGVDSSGNLNAVSCLRGVYQNLTGDTSDPFPYFAYLLAEAFPIAQVAAIPGPEIDNPWPQASFSFVGAKSTWGHDEINDIIANGGTYPDAFYLALDGLSKNMVGATQPSVPTIAFGGVTTERTDTFFTSSNPTVPQQIIFAYDVKFVQPLGTFPVSGETPAAIHSSINVFGLTMSVTSEFFFLAGADPYFTNVVTDPTDPTKLTVPWLSEDLRVFTATPFSGGLPNNLVPGGPTFDEDSTAGAYAYIQALLIHLNQTFGDPSGVDPFAPASNIIPQQQTALTDISSVTPFTIFGPLPVGPPVTHYYNNYSFAIARVRLNGSHGSAGAATGVKVFFRLWGTQTADTGWDPTETYLSQKDADNNLLGPLPPSDNHTIPFFATSAQPHFEDLNDPEYKKGGSTSTGANNQTITIMQGDSQWAYFGCYLNYYDSNVYVNGVPIPIALHGTHHCLVAEIAYAEAPIQIVGGIVPTPENSDQLAQRNLQITHSDNPGPASAHRIPQTFDVRPSAAPPTSGPLAGRPDELMIDWNNVPVGSVARIYWPAVSSADVIQLASWMYGVHPLSAADAHTIEVKTIKGVTFVPIPQGTGEGFAGLFTVDLPQTVITGQEFDIMVRRISKRLRRAKRLTYERYIVGSFQVKIPVSTRTTMLPAEETTLAIMKARLEAMPKTNRWYPVLLRYVDEIAGRVDGLGGNADAIPPSLGGYRPKPIQEEEEEFTGKVCEVVFNCFGDFTGFVLNDCCKHRAFASHEREIGDLVLRALKKRFTLTVVTAGQDGRILRLVIKG